MLSECIFFFSFWEHYYCVEETKAALLLSRGTKGIQLQSRGTKGALLVSRDTKPALFLSGTQRGHYYRYGGPKSVTVWGL